MKSFVLKSLLFLCITFSGALGNVIPHRAEYSINLSDPQKSPVKDVTGTLTIEVRDTGEGWTFEQRCLVYVKTFAGNTDTFRTTIASWESKDGKYYTFTVTSSCNEQIVDCAHGHSTADPQAPGAAVYQQPESRLISLPPGTLFPLQYLHKILRTVTSGAINLSNQIFFDGTNDNQEAVDVNLTITPLKPDLILNDKHLIDTDKAWSLQMAFFQPGSNEIDPDYELTQTILKSGIILSMKMSMAYGEETFKTKVSLKDVTVYSP